MTRCKRFCLVVSTVPPSSEVRVRAVRRPCIFSLACYSSAAQSDSPVHTSSIHQFLWVSDSLWRPPNRRAFNFFGKGSLLSTRPGYLDGCFGSAHDRHALVGTWNQEDAWEPRRYTRRQEFWLSDPRPQAFSRPFLAVRPEYLDFSFLV